MRVIKYLFCFLLIAYNSEAQNIQILDVPDDLSLSMCNWFLLSYPELEKSDKVLLVSTKACREMQKSLETYEQTFSRLDSRLIIPPDTPTKEVISELTKYYPRAIYNLLANSFTEDLDERNIEFIENKLSDLVYAIVPENLFSSEKIFRLASKLEHNEMLKIPGFPNGNRVYDCRYNAHSRVARGRSVVSCKTAYEIDDLITIAGSIGSPVMKAPSFDLIEGISLDDYVNELVMNEISLAVVGVVSSITVNPEPGEEVRLEELLTDLVDNVFPGGEDSSKSTRYLYVHFIPLIDLNVSITGANK